MPSDRFFPIHRRYVPMKGSIAGGAVALLRNSITKEPEVLGGRGIGSNKVVGIYSPPPQRTSLLADTAKPTPTVFKGGEILNKMSFVHKRGMPSADQNIKFLF